MTWRQISGTKWMDSHSKSRGHAQDRSKIAWWTEEHKSCTGRWKQNDLHGKERPLHDSMANYKYSPGCRPMCFLVHKKKPNLITRANYLVMSVRLRDIVNIIQYNKFWPLMLSWGLQPYTFQNIDVNLLTLKLTRHFNIAFVILSYFK